MRRSERQWPDRRRLWPSPERAASGSRAWPRRVCGPRARGFRTLESAAGRLQKDLSYAPIVEALRPLVAEPALIDGLSDLARLFDGLRLPPLVRLGDPGLERTRMFEAIRVLIERASSRLPVAILIDDAHWADSGTLALLQYLVRGLPRRRCLFLLTYRADEASDELL